LPIDDEAQQSSDDQVACKDDGPLALHGQNARAVGRTLPTGIAPGATVHRGKASRPRHDWPDRNANTSRLSFWISKPTHGTTRFRDNICGGAAANHLSLETVHDLAVYLSTLDAASANDGDEALAASGQVIYREGIPAAKYSLLRGLSRTEC